MSFITAIVQAIGGVTTSSNQAAAAQYMQVQGEQQSAIDFERAKEFSFYQQQKSLITALAVVVAIGIIALIFIKPRN